MVHAVADFLVLPLRLAESGPRFDPVECPLWNGKRPVEIKNQST